MRSGEDAAGYDAAVRALLGAPETAEVDTYFEGGNEVQIGDCTWDTEPYFITVQAWDRTGLKPGEQTRHWSLTFDTLPELWIALEAARTAAK